jgi:hypothetical protein
LSEPTTPIPDETTNPALDETDDWLEEEPEELPRRPRRRLLGAGANPLVVALLGVLLCACGFIGGVLVEKGEGGSSSTTGSGAANLASRLRALTGAGSSTGGSGAGTSTSSGGGASLFGRSGFTRPTAGTVAYLEGSTLYVTNSEGNTVKVNTSRATSVSKTVKSNVAAIHPGETVTITGASASNGSVSAESISVGSSAGGGLAALLGGASRFGGGGKGGSAGGGEPSLFGS